MAASSIFFVNTQSVSSATDGKILFLTLLKMFNNCFDKYPASGQSKNATYLGLAFISIQALASFILFTYLYLIPSLTILN
jgi:hypothetical protein